MTAKVLEQLNLPQSSFGQDLFAKNIRHLFDGYTFISLGVCSGTKSFLLANDHCELVFSIATRDSYVGNVVRS